MSSAVLMPAAVSQRYTRCSPRFMSDVYFLDYDAKSAVYGNQSAREQRRTIEGRYFNRLPGGPPRAGFDYNIETGFQWGSFGNRSIRAWGAGANIGWTLPGEVWRARFGLQADGISGGVVMKARSKTGEW